jgi:hypothetical protein
MVNLASKYVFVFNDIQSFLLLSLVEEYVNGAELQIQRINRNRKAILKTFRSQPDFERTKLTTHHNCQRRISHDAHFYFICIGQVSKCVDRLCTKLKNKRLHKINSQFKKEFSREIRNDLEHIDARAVGKKKQSRREVDIGFVRDFKNFSGDNLTFNGKSYPVNKEALNKLKSIYMEIIQVIHEDYALKDKNYVEKSAREKYIENVTKAVQKEYQKYIKSK